MALPARCIARHCCQISRCRVYAPNPTNRPPRSGLTGWGYAQEDNRWFSWVSFVGTNIDDINQQAFARKYSRAAGNVDDQINRVPVALRDSGKLDNTVVIIIAGRGIPLSEEEETFTWVPRSSAGAISDSLARHRRRSVLMR